MFKSHLLYPLILFGVLLFGGCSEKSAGPVVNSGSSSRSGASEAVLSGGPETDEALPGPASVHESQTPSFRILFLGDSITAGFGVDPEKAFPALIQERINELELPFIVVNAGISGETSSGGLSRIPWMLRQKIDILILELGGNDALRGIDLVVTQHNLSQIISKTKDAYPGVRVIVAGMQVPPNLGHEYTATFRSIFPELARQYNASLIPFVLEGVGGIPELNQPDQIHPTEAGHVLVADNVWEILSPILLELSSGRG